MLVEKQCNNSFIEKQIKSPNNQNTFFRNRYKILNCCCHIAAVINVGQNVPKVIFSVSFSFEDDGFDAIFKF